MNGERRNTMQPADWWALWDAEAAKEGKDLARWIGERVNSTLPMAKVAKLSERATRGRPAKEAK
jgi:hypothetical protein